MDKVSFLLFPLVILIAFVCCSAEMTDITTAKGSGQAMTREEMIQLIKNDVPNDKKNLFWDGEELSVVDDELDDWTIMDGRGGPYSYNRLKTGLGMIYSVDKENLLSEEHLLQNDTDCFCSQSNSRFIRVSVVSGDYNEMMKRHDAQCKEDAVAAYDCDWLKQGVCEQTFLIAPDGQKMIGVCFIVPLSEGMVKTYEYGGIGNFADIMDEALMMGQRSIR